VEVPEKQRSEAHRIFIANSDRRDSSLPLHFTLKGCQPDVNAALMVSTDIAVGISGKQIVSAAAIVTRTSDGVDLDLKVKPIAHGKAQVVMTIQGPEIFRTSVVVDVIVQAPPSPIQRLRSVFLDLPYALKTLILTILLYAVNKLKQRFPEFYRAWRSASGWFAVSEIKDLLQSIHEATPKKETL
jgi:hypothetical protein